MGFLGLQLNVNAWLYVALGDLVWIQVAYDWYSVGLAEELAIFSRHMPDYWHDRFSASATRLRARFLRQG